MAEKENQPRKKKQKKLIRESEPLDLSSMTELYNCTKCTKSYRLRHSLTRHLKFECGKEPRYACNMCDRKFKHKYDLNVHEKGKHGMIHVNERNGNASVHAIIPNLIQIDNHKFGNKNPINNVKIYPTILGAKN